MQTIRQAVFLAVVLFWGTMPAFGQTLDEVISEGMGAYDRVFSEGMDAYQRGDYATARRNFEGLAEKGFPEAQFNLGMMYLEGTGVPQDYASAVPLLQQAAEQGLAEAQHTLSVMYYGGRGVSQNKVMVYILTALAAAQGYEMSLNNLNVIEQELSPQQVAEGQRLANEWRVGEPLPAIDDVSTWP